VTAWLLLSLPLWAGAAQPPRPRRHRQEFGNANAIFSRDERSHPYEALGRFENQGTPRYRYTIADRAGPGPRRRGRDIPQYGCVQRSGYQKLLKEGKLAGNQWRFVDTPEAALNFYKWASCAEDPGVKQFLLRVDAGTRRNIEAAVKALYCGCCSLPEVDRSHLLQYALVYRAGGPRSHGRTPPAASGIKNALDGGEIHIKNRFDTRTDMTCSAPTRDAW